METDEPEIGQDPTLVHFQKINIFGETGVGKSTIISLMKNYNELGNEINLKIGRRDSRLTENSDFFDFSLIEEDVSSVNLNLKDNKFLNFNLYETNLDNIDKIQIYLHILLMQTECAIIVWNKNNRNTFKNIPRLISVIEQDIKDNNLRDFPIILLENNMEINPNDSQNDQLDINIDEFINKIKEENKNISFQKLEINTKENFRYFLLEISQIIHNYENTKNEYVRNNDIVNLIKFNPKCITEVIKKEEKKLKCLLLGHSNVGKTTFFKCFMNNKSINNISTIGIEFINIMAEVCGEKIILKLIDTAGQERFAKIANNTIRNVNGVLLFYDIVDRESFDKVSNWINQIKEINENNAEIILIANKIDLFEKRNVAKTEAINFAQIHNIKYFECSCKSKINIYEILNEILLSMYKSYKVNPNIGNQSFRLRNNEEPKIDDNIDDKIDNVNNDIIKENKKNIKTKRKCCH